MLGKIIVLDERPHLPHFTWTNSLQSESPIRTNKFLKVPQIVWGLNNQKIAFARACLTARLLNRTLLLPNLSASLFYKEIDQLQPISFDKVFNFTKFNNQCGGFVRLGRSSDLSKKGNQIEIQKGSGRRWTAERDLEQLNQIRSGDDDAAEVIRITGKNPFLWPDHWPLNHYAKIFDCMVLVDEIADVASKVTAKIRSDGSPSYIAVHMRIEKDWMIHCKHLEQRSNKREICSSKDEIVSRIGMIPGLVLPAIVYVAVADSLLEDQSLLKGWKTGLVPLDKKTVGAWELYEPWPYLIRSAIDFEVCKRADVFVGNSYSTFSSLVVLERTETLRKGGAKTCGSSYAYNLVGDDGGIRAWTTDMDASDLQAISYGTSNISCHK
ncbi:O-fucosyltransferase family protein isoform X2 [Wolffia australiana]